MNQVFATLHASPQTVYAVCAGLDVSLSLSHFSLILCDVLSYPLSAIPVCISSPLPLSALTAWLTLSAAGGEKYKNHEDYSLPYN